MRKRAMVLTLIGVLLSAVFAGCSQGGGKNAGGDPSAQNGGDADDAALTAHLTMYTDLSLSDEWFRKFVFDPVEKKFPGVKIDLVRRQQGSTPNDLVAAGSFPDILYNSTPRLTTYKDLGLLYDMRDLIKKYNFDTSRLNQAALDAIKQWGTGQGEIYGLPFWVNWTALFYNKDIFDKFAVPYPKDGMTWEEAIELSRRLNRTEGGVNYRGLDIHDMNSFYSQLSLPYVDAKTDTALLETDGFKKVYETLLSLVKIPGNENRPSAKDAFLKDKNLAMWPMYADVPTWINDLIASGEKFNWDMAQMPSFKERPNVAWQVDSHNLHVTSMSNNKDAAFRVIQYLLSEEPQLHLVRNGLLSALKDENMNKRFGESMALFEGKNVQAIFKSQPAPKYSMHKYDSIVQGEFTKAFKDVEEGTKDINTALRDANEAANKRIQEQKASGK